jgi:hypothetical protein
LLKKNPKKIKLKWLSFNPNIFEPDYQAMTINRTKIIYQELMEQAWHPSRVITWIEADIDF